MASKTAAPGLRVRKLADTSEGERVKRYDPVTGAAKLVNPATDGDEHEAWPLLGVQFEDGAPKTVRVSTNYVAQGIAEGWIETENPQIVHRPGGPAADPWRVTHTFTHADAVVFHMVDGDYRYAVVRQPDKYAVEETGETDPKTGEARVEAVDKQTVTDDIYAAGQTTVDKFYDLKLEG